MYPELLCESRSAPACFACIIAKKPFPETRAIVAKEGGSLAVRAMSELAIEPGTRIGDVELVGVRVRDMTVDPFLENYILDAAHQAIANPRCIS